MCSIDFVSFPARILPAGIACMSSLQVGVQIDPPHAQSPNRTSRTSVRARYVATRRSVVVTRSARPCQRSGCVLIHERPRKRNKKKTSSYQSIKAYQTALHLASTLSIFRLRDISTCSISMGRACLLRMHLPRLHALHLPQKGSTTWVGTWYHWASHAH